MPAFKAEPSPESNEAWHALSMGHSLVELNKSEAQTMYIGDGLPTTNPATELYGVSWTHQLHCLVSCVLINVFDTVATPIVVAMMRTLMRLRRG